MSRKPSYSFSLVEVLVFVSIFSIFFVIAATVVVTSLRNMKYNEHKIIATHYAEELLNWVRTKKEEDWSVFLNYSDKIYCFNSSISNEINFPPSGLCQGEGEYGLDNFYKRELSLTTLDLKTIKVEISVSWREVGNLYTVPLSTILTLWE